MKKISLMLAALGGMLAFSACTESKDDHPILYPNDGVQQADFLNIPEMANMSIALTPENAGGSLHLTCSQPDYGFAASTTYEVEVSFSQDFTTPVVDGMPASVILGTSFHNCAEINPINGEIATAISDMLGVVEDDQVPTPYRELFVRLIANIHSVASESNLSTTYVSNVVSFKAVSLTYLTAIAPGQPTGIFLRGGFNDWGATPASEFLTTTEAGVYEIPEISIGQGVEFKVADANWATINLGATDEEFKVNTPYVLNGGNNPGNLMMPVEFSGRVQLTVKGDKYTILFEAAEPDEPGQQTGIFLRGEFNGWGTDAASEFLTSTVKNTWVIENIALPAGKFKVADENWGTYNLGGSEPIVPGVAYQLEPGGGDIMLENPFAGTIKLSPRGGNYYLTLIEN